jgi:hypothetical protein
MIGKIVKFKEDVTGLAAQWCVKNNVPGKVIGTESGRLRINVGLQYSVYVYPEQVTVISESGDIEPLTIAVIKSAPVPDDF